MQLFIIIIKINKGRKSKLEVGAISYQNIRPKTKLRAMIKSISPAKTGVKGIKSLGKYTFDSILDEPMRLWVDLVIAVEK